MEECRASNRHRQTVADLVSRSPCATVNRSRTPGDVWRTEPKPPAISTFLTAARKHQRRLDEVFRQLGDILEAADWAEDQIKPKKPPVRYVDDPDHIPF